MEKVNKENALDSDKKWLIFLFFFTTSYIQNMLFTSLKEYKLVTFKNKENVIQYYIWQLSNLLFYDIFLN